jgi:hypothetical protein
MRDLAERFQNAPAGTLSIEMKNQRWQVSGSYFEVCNCDAPCSCRRHDGKPGTGSQFATCDFVLSWLVRDGHFGSQDLRDLRVALAGFWDSHEPAKPGGSPHPWHVVLYIDDRANAEQHSALERIFTGKSGGTALRNYAQAIGEVRAVRPAHIEIDHTRGREWLRIGESVRAEIAKVFPTTESVTCGIPGHDRPGQEMVSGIVQVDDDALQLAFTGRCGFSTEFCYRSEDEPAN